MQEVQQILDIVSKVGVLGGLSLFIYAHFKGWIRWGKDYDELHDTLDKCLDLADKRNAKQEARLEQLERDSYGFRGRRRDED